MNTLGGGGGGAKASRGVENASGDDDKSTFPRDGRTGEGGGITEGPSQMKGFRDVARLG